MSGIMVTVIFDDDTEYTDEQFSELVDKTTSAIQGLDEVQDVNIEDTFD